MQHTSRRSARAYRVARVRAFDCSPSNATAELKSSAAIMAPAAAPRRLCPRAFASLCTSATAGNPRSCRRSGGCAGSPCASRTLGTSVAVRRLESLAALEQQSVQGRPVAVGRLHSWALTWPPSLPPPLLLWPWPWLEPLSMSLRAASCGQQGAAGGGGITASRPACSTCSGPEGSGGRALGPPPPPSGSRVASMSSLGACSPSTTESQRSKPAT